MLAARLLLGGLAIFAASCDSLAARLPKMLTDGCYYLDGQAVFRIVGSRGRVLIPGDVRDFGVRRRRTRLAAAEVTFEPAFLFNGGGGSAVTAEAWYDRRAWSFPMKARTSVPTVQMNWVAHGSSDVARGAHC
ncbi:MAG TPA: hypothetical protein VF603_09155 [Allosphingosinicella sp.]|jgi:hypothetical protein